MKNRENASFINFKNDEVGLLFDDSTNEKYPIKYYNVLNGIGFESKPNSSYYGFVYSGTTEIISDGRPKGSVAKGMYFSIAGEFIINPSCESKVILIEVLQDKGIYPKNKYKAVYTIGGPIEESGRLNYIDGCTDSLLIPPVKLGDPCFNHLHFPNNIEQTPHTHPSHRIGIVARGKGICVTPFGNLPLEEGMIFVIKEWDGVSFEKAEDGNVYEIGNHCFYTQSEGMDVIAFHPDSDFGPQDENHPMINRTIVKGISANSIDTIRTK